MKRLAILLGFVTVFQAASAQSGNAYLQAANNYYQAGDYYSAATYYEKYLTGAGSSGFNPYEMRTAGRNTATEQLSKYEVRYRTAESYRLLHYPSKSIPHYRVVAKNAAASFPLATLHLANALKAEGKAEEARVAYNEFLQGYTATDKYSDEARRELQGIDFAAQELAKDVSKFTISKNTSLDAAGGTYAPVLNGSQIFFTSTRPVAGQTKTFNRIFQADFSNGVAGNPAVIAMPGTENMDQAAIALSPDGNRMYITRWIDFAGKKISSIYISNRSGNEWSEATASNINVEGFSSQQPAIMGNQLLFSSNRPGGKGGLDIWAAPIQADGSLGAPVNLDALNTIGDEQAPYYHEPSRSLIFSSNGLVGMGGFDFYRSQMNAENIFTTPVNLGHPVNSVKNDIYMASTGNAFNYLQNVIIASDRDEDCCMKLYSLSKADFVRTVSGQVVDCKTRQPISGATVKITDVGGKTYDLTTDASGNYSVPVEEFKNLNVTASQPGYFNGIIRTYEPDDFEKEIFAMNTICLEPIPQRAIRVENVYYEFDKASLNPESYPALDSLVQLLNDNPDMRIELSAHTDSKGSDAYNLRLSDGRAKSVVDYLVSKGINQNRLISKGYGEAQPVAPNTNADGTDNPDGRAQNRRTEFRVIQ